MSQQYPTTPFDTGRVLRHLAADPPPPATPFSASLTYELYYGLKEKPFSLSADPRFLYHSPTHGPAFEDLLNGIRRREGLIVLTGEIGTGKTTVIRSVLQNLDRRTFSAFVPDPFVSREDLLKMLLVDFGVVSIADLKRGSLNGASRPDLSYPLYEFLDSLVPLQAFAVLVVDEAQNLPLPLLEEIRILSDLEGREKLLQVVLVGQPELRTSLKLPQMRQVDQRVSVRCELSRLGLDDIGGYVRHRLNVAGDGDCRVEFSDAAIAAVHERSGGTPRLINLICDRALHRGHAARASRIEPEFVRQAIRDLGLDDEPAARDESPREETIPASAPEPAAWISDVDAAPAPMPEAVATPPVARRPAVARPVANALAPRSAAPSTVLSDFAAENEPPPRAVKVVLPPPRKWNAGRLWAIAAFALILAALLCLYLYAQLQAADAPAVKLPAPPPRAVLPSLAVPRVATLEEVPAPVAPRTANSSTPAETHRFAIQVASFQTQAAADRMIAELAAAGHEAHSVTLDAGPPRGTLVQVLVGRYASADEAQDDLERMRERFADARVSRVLVR